MENKENKVKFGLKKVHYALLTEAEGKYTFGTPVAIPGAVNLSLDQVGDVSKFRADNVDYYVTAANNGYEGDLEIALVPEQFRVDVLKETKDTANVLIENSNTRPAPFALLFQFDGDAKEVLHVLYNCSVTRPSISSQTTDTSITPVTDTLKLTASPLADGRVKASTTANTEDATRATWFAKVYESEAAAASN